MRTGTVSYKLEDLKKRVIIPIGFVGENDFTRVIFDAEEIYKKYPRASVSMKVQPPKGVIYPAAVTRDGNTVIWQVKEADVANRGGGELQLTFTDSETKIKTYIAKTDVKRSLAGNGPAPDPIQDWIDDAEEVLDDLDAMDTIAKNAQAGDIGKALSPKTVEDGVVTEWQYIEMGGGTEDYSDLENKPSIGGVTLAGDKSLHELGIAAENDIPDVSGKANLTVIAPAFDQATANDAGSMVTYTDGVVYVLPDGHTAGTTWANTTKTATNIDTELRLQKTAIHGKAETEITSETGIDLDITDEQGNVLVRLQNGEIQTKEFDSSLVADTKPTTETFSDLDITDPDGNVVLRLEDGNIKTKKFDSTDPFYVPEYYHTNNYLKNKCDRLNEIARACAKKSDTFAFVTDLHWHLNAKKSPALLKYIKENTRIDKYFCGGDICDFIESEHQPYDSFTPFIGALNKPIYTAMGNHDYMSIRGTEGRLYYSFNSIGRDRIGNFDRNYFYIDNPQSQIRYIFLNGFQPNGSGSWAWGLEQEQITWLNNVALDLDSGWGAVIVTHMIVGIDLDTMTLYKPTMATNLLNELDNYNGNGEIIAVICGHTHFDYVDHSTGGIPIIVTTCDKYAPWISSGVDKEPFLSDRVEGTITEQAIDLFVIDREAKKITRVRVGVPIHDGFDPETWTEVEEETVSYDRN